jgi:cytochrome c peroxidase
MRRRVTPGRSSAIGAPGAALVAALTTVLSVGGATATTGVMPSDPIASSADPNADPGAPPAGLDAATWTALIPADNSMTAARVALGKRLFFEPALSRDGTVACASCHDSAHGFADPRPVSLGVGGKAGARNAPSAMNTALLARQFWDGRAPSLEAQAVGPILNPIEMAMPSPAAAVAALTRKGYGPDFLQAYARPIAFDDVARAIATYERTLIFLRAPFDRFMAGQADALSPAARAGWRLFRGRGKCATCHVLSPTSPLGTDNLFHNIGVSARAPGFEATTTRALAALAALPGGTVAPGSRSWQRLTAGADLAPLGRFAITGRPEDLGAFRSSPLRNVGLTAPYMHDGSQATLWDTIDFYNNGGVLHPQLDKAIQPLDLGDEEIDQLVAFLFALTDERFAGQGQAEFERQQAIARSHRPIRDEIGLMVRVPSLQTRASARPRP